MYRLLTISFISALLGSVIGTVISTILLGGVGALLPIRFTVGTACASFGFTLGGSAMLMGAIFSLAKREVPEPLAALILVGMGICLGAAMLALFSPYMMLVGAMFGGITAVSFTGLLLVLWAYPRGKR